MHDPAHRGAARCHLKASTPLLDLGVHTFARASGFAAGVSACPSAIRSGLTNIITSIYTCCRGFKRRAGKSIGAAAPTDGIACPHGALLPESRGGRARRAAVPPAVWAHFSAAWREERQVAAEAATAAARAER